MEGNTKVAQSTKQGMKTKINHYFPDHIITLLSSVVISHTHHINQTYCNYATQAKMQCQNHVFQIALTILQIYTKSSCRVLYLGMVQVTPDYIFAKNTKHIGY